MKKIILWIARRRPGRVISGPDGEPYLQRFYLFRFLGFVFYLHRFVASDPDRGLHDHPWIIAWSLILHGHYNELRVVDANKTAPIILDLRHYKAGQINTLYGDTWHRVILPKGVNEVWSLFFHWRRCKGWGFFKYEPTTTGAVGLVESMPYAINRQWDKSDWWKNKNCPKGVEVLE